MILIYITCKNEKEAKRVSGHLLSKRLIACANIFPIKSVYRWKGKICRCNETAMIVKTKDSRYNQIKKEVEKIHSYDIPCVIKIRADANKKYNDWINREVK